MYSVTAIIFLAVFVQSISGFGSALVAMAFLPAILGLRVAAPVVALVSFPLEIALLLRYRQSLRLSALWQLILPSIIGIPLGITILRRVDERLVSGGLGVLIAGYAIYALLNLHPPRLISPNWAYLAGFLSGLLGGAYNTSGPPVVIYASAKDWTPSEFRSNLQAFFITINLFVLTGHALGGSFNPSVWQAFLWSLPAIPLGVLLAAGLDSYLNPRIFRQVVLLLLVVMGINLIV